MTSLLAKMVIATLILAVPALMTYLLYLDFRTNEIINQMGTEEDEDDN